MKILSYLWTALIGLIEIGIVIALFSNSPYNDSFQLKVLAILVIIYTTIRTIGMSLGRGLVGLIYKTDAEFKQLKKVSSLINEESTEIEKQEQEEAVKNIKKLEVKSIINTFTIAIIYFIAVYNLVSNL